MFIFKRPLVGVIAGLATALLIVYLANSYGSPQGESGSGPTPVAGAAMVAVPAVAAVHPEESTPRPPG